MSNRKKPKNRRLIFKRALGETADNLGLETSLQKLDAPDDEKVLLKEVPATVDGEVVGTALIYDDRSVDVIYNHDISDEAKAKLDAVTAQYKKMMGEFN